MSKIGMCYARKLNDFFVASYNSVVLKLMVRDKNFQSVLKMTFIN